MLQRGERERRGRKKGIHSLSACHCWLAHVWRGNLWSFIPFHSLFDSTWEVGATGDQVNRTVTFSKVMDFSGWNTCDNVSAQLNKLYNKRLAVCRPFSAEILHIILLNTLFYRGSSLHKQVFITTSALYSCWEAANTTRKKYDQTLRSTSRIMSEQQYNPPHTEKAQPTLLFKDNNRKVHSLFIVFVIIWQRTAVMRVFSQLQACSRPLFIDFVTCSMLRVPGNMFIMYKFWPSPEAKQSL